MTDYDKTNTGIISKNDRKEKDSHPDIKGTLNVEGRDFWIRGWKKDRKDGTGSFYSLSVKLKDAPADSSASQQAQAAPIDEEGIPF